MDRKQIRKSRIEIPLSSKPRPYRPGDGPALAPIRLALENDSSAFILDRRVLPGKSADGELKLQMYYVVGWPDLPGARVSILATQIYDYVSPRVLEDYEYNCSLENDRQQELKEAAAEKRKAQIAAAKVKAKAKAPATSAGTSGPAIPLVPGQRKRGRPSKAEVQARKLAQQASYNSDEAHNIEIELPSTRTTGPSLSTPQKKYTTELTTDMEDLDEADPDEAIYRQLNGDDTDDMDVDPLAGDGNITYESFMQLLRTSAPTMQSFAESHSLNTDSTEYKQANGRLALKSSTSHIPVPQVLRSNKQFPPPKDFDGRSSTTPIPVPKPIGSDKPYQPPRPFDGRPSTSHVPVPPVLKSDKITPRPKPFDGKHSTTPIPVPTWPRPKDHAPHTPASAPQQPKSTLQHYGFTPAGRSSGRFSESSSSKPELPDPESRSRNSSRKPKPPPPPPQSEEDQVWVVKRLEADKLVHLDDGGPAQRYFRVRWEGDWPPDQNPTWEPEGNIAPPLVRKYLKKKAARGGRGSGGGGFGASGSNRTPGAPMVLKRKYSSVAEAFEGDAGEAGVDPLSLLSPPAHGTNAGPSSYANQQQQEDEEDEDGEERLLVTEQRSAGSPPLLASEDFNAVLKRDLERVSSFLGGDGSPGF
ncbi:hypothetical protein F5B20DRAFT_548585 [Whalleya microplaca]|nr:hypothetical protein F5B20DRAFT_548585 [Whalleya microplaca]